MYCTANRFPEIPFFVFEMGRLKKLQFTKNQISELASVLGNLTELRHFNMAGNRIAIIPESIAKLPEAFGRVQIVNQLRVRNTKLTALPAGFAIMLYHRHHRILQRPRLASPALRARINTEKPPDSKEEDKLIVRRPN